LLLLFADFNDLRFVDFPLGCGVALVAFLLGFALLARLLLVDSNVLDNTMK
jgi:hypothetical protein